MKQYVVQEIVKCDEFRGNHNVTGLDDCPHCRGMGMVRVDVDLEKALIEIIRRNGELSNYINGETRRYA